VFFVAHGSSRAAFEPCSKVRVYLIAPRPTANEQQCRGREPVTTITREASPVAILPRK